MRLRTFLSSVITMAAAALLALLGAQGAHAGPESVSESVPAPIPQQSPQPYVVGGQDASQTYPYTVSMQEPGGSHHCVGVLVAPDWVITAGHCVVGHHPSEYQYRLASADRTTGGVVVGADSFVPHPNYSSYRATFDVALIHLSQPVAVPPVPMATESPDAGTTARLLGWGQTCPTNGCGSPSQTLQETDSWVLDDSACTSLYGTINGPGELCVASPNGTAACYGDSGGPALVMVDGRYVLAGTTSRGTGRTCTAGPSIYTDVAAFQDWIHATTGTAG